MQIWVDADACPKPVKEMLLRAAKRVEVHVCFVANHPVPVPRSALVSFVQVPAGFDIADNHIAQNMEPGDLVITQDIPLAAEVIELGGTAINPRGSTYTKENVRQRLNMRDFMEELRATGQVGGGPPPFNNTDKQTFANALDRWLARNCQ